VTTRFEETWENTPLVCHDIFTGDTLWTRELGGRNNGTSVPLGFKNNVVYASNYTGGAGKDLLYALNAENGDIIWVNDIGIIGAYYLGCTFTDNGDFILPISNDRVARFNHKNGDTLWTVKRLVFATPSYCGLSIYKETAYGWELGPSNEAMIVAIDIKTGKKRYRIEIPRTGSPKPYAVGPLPVIDSDGIIYVHKSNDNLVALRDNVDSLSIIWSDTIRDGGTGKPALGPDGSIYFTNHKRIMKADTKTGKIIDSSMIIVVDTNYDINGHYAIDAKGTVYFNPCYHQIYFAFKYDLQLNWTDSIKHISYGGPALSKHGLLAVAGADDILRVFRPVNLQTNKSIKTNKKIPILHQCYPDYFIFKCHITQHTKVKLVLYNVLGQQVYCAEKASVNPGYHTKRINIPSGSGQYIYKIYMGSDYFTDKITVIK